MPTTISQPTLSTASRARSRATAAATTGHIARPWWRAPVVCIAFVGAMAPMCLGALLGPTLVFLVPVLLPSAAFLLSGTLQWLDERQRQAERAARRKTIE